MKEITDPIYSNFRKYISPPNPIISKTIVEPDFTKQTGKLKDSELYENSDAEDGQIIGDINLFSLYLAKSLIFRKWGKNNNQRDKNRYFASHFCSNAADTKSYDGMLIEDELLFDSNFESANLFAVYKVGERQYDLIMQNDSNSSGYTQWFNFIVSNKTKHISVTFNIVNFYKKDSLFLHGMKPLVRSLIHDKGWKRGTYNILYESNDILVEGRKIRYYKTLSFKYDFNYENDTTQFAYTFPYTLQHLQTFVKGINSPKLRTKYIGITACKKVMTMIQIYASEKGSKKAIIFLARQHSGETCSSFIIQYVIQQLLYSNMQSEFLLSNFDFYIFPMVNLDGVVLGNYRTNFYGFDLNRCWDQDDSRQPEIMHIKAEIKKIMKRQQIELILDLHGHSTKLNSFFYGNSFGKNNLLLPYIASKIEPFVDFSSCTFSDQNDSKSKTARVILGNMIRETGSVYTYEVSFYGGIRNGKRVVFTIDHYRQLAKSLVISMHKMFIELYKEQKFMKESLFLKEMKKELRKIDFDKAENDNSDDEAIKTTFIQAKAKQKGHLSISSKQKGFLSLPYVKGVEQAGVQVEITNIEQDRFSFRKCMEKKEQKKKKGKGAKQESKSKQMSFQFLKVNDQQQIHKEFLMHKLRVFGETFASPKFYPSQEQPNYKSIGSQTNLTYRYLIQRQSIGTEIKEDQQILYVGNMMGFSKKRHSFRLNKLTHHDLTSHKMTIALSNRLP